MGRVGIGESADALRSLRINSYVDRLVTETRLFAFQLEPMKTEKFRGRPHQTFEAWRENIPVHANVNWNHCYEDVAQR